MLELEIIESVDCTEELNEISSNINGLQTAYGDTTGLNRHLAKEKAKYYDEANDFVRNIQTETNIPYRDDHFRTKSVRYTSNSPFQKGVENPNKNTQLFSPLSRANRTSIIFQENPRHLRNGSIENNYFQSNRPKRHTRVVSDLNNVFSKHSPLRVSSGTPNEWGQGSMNFDWLLNSQKNHVDPKEPRNLQSAFSKSKVARSNRMSIRKSVLKQYNRLRTKISNFENSFYSIKGSTQHSFQQ